jgi:hypothetical protein
MVIRILSHTKKLKKGRYCWAVVWFGKAGLRSIARIADGIFKKCILAGYKILYSAKISYFFKKWLG